jgi:hypothetical protein
MNHPDYLQEVFEQLISDLQYPVAKNGDVLDTHAIRPGIAYHLVRAGWRKPNNADGLALRDDEQHWDDPQIKKRKVYGPGVIEDAVTWVPVTDPDDPLEDLQNMTVAQIEALPADLRDEAKRRLGLLPPLPTKADSENLQPAWSVAPSINITDADDVENHWT